MIRSANFSHVVDHIDVVELNQQLQPIKFEPPFFVRSKLLFDMFTSIMNSEFIGNPLLALVSREILDCDWGKK